KIEQKGFKKRHTSTIDSGAATETCNPVIEVAIRAPEPDRIDSVLQSCLRIDFHVCRRKSERPPELLAVNDFTAHRIAITEKPRRLNDIAFAKQIPYSGR